MTETMTSREYFQTVLNAHLSDKMDDMSIKLLARLDTKNAKRKTTPSKEQIAAAERREQVRAFLMEQDEPATRDVIAAALNISVGQASAACKALGDAVTKSEIKVDKARKVAYSIAK